MQRFAANVNEPLIGTLLLAKIGIFQSATGVAESIKTLDYFSAVSMVNFFS